MGITFDATISLGTIIQLVMIILGVAALYWRIRFALISIKAAVDGHIEKVSLQFLHVSERIVSLESGMGRLTDVLIVLARTEERMNAVDARMNHLESKVNGVA